MASTSSSAPNERGANLMRSSLSSASSLMALQLFSRLFTFALNQALFRLASPQAYGTAAIQFELILSTILFLSREGVRNALLRAWPQKASAQRDAKGKRVKDPSYIDAVKAATNLSTLPFIVGFPISAVTALLYGQFTAAETRNQPHFRAALLIYVIAAMSELLSEPMHNQAMGEVRTQIRVRAEGLGITSKTAATILVLLYDSRRGREAGELSLIAFAFGQMIYSLSIFMMYTVRLGRPPLWPQRLRRPFASTEGVAHTTMSKYFDPASLSLSWSMTSQSLVKHFLTEGDKFIISWLSSLGDQGGYAIAVNYGSLIARIVFQPVEEICRVFFSRILSSSNGQEGSSEAPSKGGVDYELAMRQASEALLSLLSIQLTFTIIVVIFGSSYLPVFLHLLLPPQYLSTSAPRVLLAWVYYIPFLAVNGGLEAFLSSVATPKDLARQSRWMAVFSLIYVGAAITLYSLQFGDTSLVYANIVNLSARIIYALYFVFSFFRTRQMGHLLKWRNVWPTWQILLTSMLSFSLITYSGRHFRVMTILREGGRGALLTVPVLAHLGLGVTLGLTCVAVWWISCGQKLVAQSRPKVA
ncbi:hypothetical protein SERLADRAFT_358206 [Serpula lacrymans var. lacrymans S7.9]|uniref:Man(5)GlcNAc(2)-PP-dolichol translocation protein RFT1 n=1 Tax=Serpula lacrymans var. lacrymans (strain S7.9) TaxID=578457 RepID=F8P9M3_SERL9|nr:uncharacterized protein SERLADRAFT_358206 [Serpula lacrymans var. lacrymans S7.9]EGO20352.1 hypothetical protein SERLADRAFT_358206 [Serpula lacrymans var. lacrymans S7.9]